MNHYESPTENGTSVENHGPSTKNVLQVVQMDACDELAISTIFNSSQTSFDQSTPEFSELMLGIMKKPEKSGAKSW